MSSTNTKWRKNNPAKVHAHSVIWEHIRTGRLTPKVCEVCGNSKTHAHHDDYSKLLEVRWLSSRCHRKYHATEKGQAVTPEHQREKERLRGIRKQNHARLHPAKRSPNNPLREQAEQLRKNRLSYQQIATLLGVTKGSVYKWLNPVAYR